MQVQSNPSTSDASEGVLDASATDAVTLRFVRARETLAHTRATTGCDWLWSLTGRNVRRAEARLTLEAEELEAAGRRRFDRTERRQGVY